MKPSGDPKWKNRLCLRSSNHIYNQSLLATMIKRFGEAKVEAIVRGWVANNPILINSDTRILESIAAGECVMSASPIPIIWDAYWRKSPTSQWRRFGPISKRPGRTLTSLVLGSQPTLSTVPMP